MCIDEDMAAARSPIHKELLSSLGFLNASEEQVQQGSIAFAQEESVSAEEYWPTLRPTMICDPSTNRLVDPSSLSPEAQISAYKAQLEADRAATAGDTVKAAKQEKKLGIQLGGYAIWSEDLAKRTTAAFDAVPKEQIDFGSFSSLAGMEHVTAPYRTEALRLEFGTLESGEVVAVAVQVVG